MRICLIIILTISLIFGSCSGTKKQLRKNKKSKVENISDIPVVKPVAEPEVQIKEIEEKLVPMNEKLPDPHHYFVITGSFRNPENAKKYQTTLVRQGFISEIHKNDSGLYRVSVLSTDEIEAAREKIRQIRRLFPEYYDTWLLVQKK